MEVPVPKDDELPADGLAPLKPVPPISIYRRARRDLAGWATQLILTLSFYWPVARFTNPTKAPIEADNPLASASNLNLG